MEEKFSTSNRVDMCFRVGILKEEYHKFGSLMVGIEDEINCVEMNHPPYAPLLPCYSPAQAATPSPGRRCC